MDCFAVKNTARNDEAIFPLTRLAPANAVAKRPLPQGRGDIIYSTKLPQGEVTMHRVVSLLNHQYFLYNVRKFRDAPHVGLHLLLYASNVRI